MSLLEVKDLYVGYGGLTIVKGASCEVNSGQVTVLLGSNGAGKTTLIGGIAGLNRVGSGKVIFNGAEIQSTPSYKIAELGLCLVPQGRGLFPSMSVLDNLYLGSYVKRAKVKRQSSLDYVYSLFPKLKERSTQKAGNLSGGEQQMLAIGRALMSDPKLLMLDEPSLGLAPMMVDQVFKSIKNIREQKNIGILLVEQNLAKALSVADIGYVVESGRIAISGTKEELSKNEGIKKAYLGI